MQMDRGGITFSEQKSCFFPFFEGEIWREQLLVAAGMGCCSAAPRGEQGGLCSAPKPPATPVLKGPRTAWERELTKPRNVSKTIKEHI